jgi:DNA polymerase-3 subunit delta
VASFFGHLTLITGPEAYLAEREVSRRIAQAKAQTPEARVASAIAADLTPTDLEQMSGTDLFSSATIACITEAHYTPKDIEQQLLTLARDVPDHLALIVSHAGGNQGKAILDKLSSLAATVLPHPLLKPKDLPGFVMDEVKSRQRKIAPDAPQALIESVGQDTRSLAAAVSQILADSETDEVISVSVVTKYFGGLATVTPYAVSDDVMAGRVGDAIVKLRWALATGVAHTRITSALASSLRQIGIYLTLAATKRQPRAEDIGIPQWRLKSFVPVARAWSPKAVAGAIRAVSQADAQVKGAAQDPDYALERLIIRLASLRRTAHDS